MGTGVPRAPALRGSIDRTALVPSLDAVGAAAARASDPAVATGAASVPTGISGGRSEYHAPATSAKKTTTQAAERCFMILPGRIRRLSPQSYRWERSYYRM